MNGYIFRFINILRMLRLARACSTRSALRTYSTATASRPAGWASCIDEAGSAAATPYRTHSVANQATPLEDYNAYSCDPTLSEALHRYDASWAEAHISAFGACVGSSQYMEHARLANTHKPVLHTHDRHGRHVDVVGRRRR